MKPKTPENILVVPTYENEKSYEILILISNIVFLNQYFQIPLLNISKSLFYYSIKQLQAAIVN